MTFIKRLFTRYTPSTKEMMLTSIFSQGEHRFDNIWWQ